jgi:hypothetical protein
MKKVFFLFALCFCFVLTVGLSQPDGYVKVKTEQSAALVNAQSADYL